MIFNGFWKFRWPWSKYVNFFFLKVKDPLKVCRFADDLVTVFSLVVCFSQNFYEILFFWWRIPRQKLSCNYMKPCMVPLGWRLKVIVRAEWKTLPFNNDSVKLPDFQLQPTEVPFVPENSQKKCHYLLRG